MSEDKADSKVTPTPAAKTVYDTAHANNDADQSDKAIHHTIGKGTFQAARGKDLADLITNLNLDGVWIDADLDGAWVNNGAPTGGAKFTKRGDRVQLQGTVKDGTGLIFILPEGYRPVGTCLFSCLSHGGANYGHTRVDVTSDGHVTVIAHVGPGGNTFMTLDEVSFLTSQGGQ